MKTYFLDVITNHYVDVKGCATRKQFWLWLLWSWIIGMIFMFAVGMAGSLLSEGKETAQKVVAVIWVLYFFFVVFIPSLAIQARRLHDTNRSGWWQVIQFLPYINIIGGIVIFVFNVLPTVTEGNRFK